MAPSKRFQPVQRVAESRENKAARELGLSQRKLRENQDKLDDLKQYHKEYMDRFLGAAQQGLSASQLQEYRAFLRKLEMAIGEQEQILKNSHEECSGKKDMWQEKHIRSQALSKAMDRFVSAERKTMDGQEQKETDDRNQWQAKED
ncbi:MAG: flagellar export protein FliJ [Gammaproteobacteria bacterium]|nr:flagellar export protein FliJ [Gammaproteobacteria bacterium]